jgi:hypothetical protein
MFLDLNEDMPKSEVTEEFASRCLTESKSAEPFKKGICDEFAGLLSNEGFADTEEVRLKQPGAVELNDWDWGSKHKDSDFEIVFNEKVMGVEVTLIGWRHGVSSWRDFHNWLSAHSQVRPSVRALIAAISDARSPGADATWEPRF